MNKVFLLGVIMMSIVLVVSNYLVRFPLGDWLTWAAFTYPIAFLVTDCVNRIAGAAIATRVVLVGFIIGLPLSFLFIYADPDSHWIEAARVAGASGLAFVFAQSIDVIIFDRLRQSTSWWLPPVLSSSPASLVDTTVFFAVAFAGTDVPWVSLAIGDLMVKMVMALLLLPSYRLIIGRWGVA